MPLNFPDSPSLNQVYTSGSNSWQWDGTVWNALSSATIVSSYGPTGPTGAASSFSTTTQTLDFSQSINQISFIVSGLTKSNQVYAFDNMNGMTAHLKNSDGTITIVGTVENSSSYFDSSGITLNYRSVDMIMKPPFTMGITSYYAEDLLGLTLSFFGCNNIFTRLYGSHIINDGATAGLTFNLGITFPSSSFALFHKQDTHTTMTVTGQSWVTDESYIVCKVLGLTSADHEPEDAILEGVRFEINNIVSGTGFDIIGHAPEGTYGKYKIKCLGL
jgi:hypothetical protein